MLEDGACAVGIPANTTARDADQNPLPAIEILPVEDIPTLPEHTNIIGLAYDFGPDGATFDPAIIIRMEYDPELLPEGVSEEDLAIAYYDTETDTWIELECEVDVENNVIIASAQHFTVFAVLAAETPASFTLSNLTLNPSTVDMDETTTITVNLTNTGALSGTYMAILMISGEEADVKEVTLAGGMSTTITFEAAQDEAGTYEVQIGDLMGSFEVLAPVGISWALVGGIIGAVVLLALVAAGVISRRRRVTQE